MFNADNNEEVSRLAVWIPKSQHQALRVFAMKTGRNLYAIVADALTAYMEKRR